MQLSKDSLIQEKGSPQESRFGMGAIQKSSDIKEAANLKNYWTHVSCMYNMQGHGLAVKNTGTPCDRGGGG